MRLDNQPHRFYCGVDLHARSLYTDILDHTGKTVLDRDLPAVLQVFLEAVAPFRNGLVVGAECMFACRTRGSSGASTSVPGRRRARPWPCSKRRSAAPCIIFGGSSCPSTGGAS